jgi:hypothetical protein
MWGEKGRLLPCPIVVRGLPVCNGIYPFCGTNKGHLCLLSPKLIEKQADDDPDLYQASIKFGTYSILKYVVVMVGFFLTLRYL